MNSSNLHPECVILVERFSRIDGVIAVALGGSRSRGTNDSQSDYDMYIYSTRTLAVDERRQALEGLFSYCEMNNTFWETEDDGVFKDCAIPVDIIYRDFSWLEDHVRNTWEKYQASTGYSTCVLENLASSLVLFDPEGRYARLREKTLQVYPERLKQAIIDKNLPLLRNWLPSFSQQLYKAWERDDVVAVNHRLAAFLASYMDVLFAVNGALHPGEKRILAMVRERCPLVPANFTTAVQELVQASASVPDGSSKAQAIIERLCDELEHLISESGLTLPRPPSAPASA